VQKANLPHYAVNASESYELRERKKRTTAKSV
jgi:hypothetical protein